MEDKELQELEEFTLEDIIKEFSDHPVAEIKEEETYKTYEKFCYALRDYIVFQKKIVEYEKVEKKYNSNKLYTFNIGVIIRQNRRFKNDGQRNENYGRTHQSASVKHKSNARAYSTSFSVCKQKVC